MTIEGINDPDFLDLATCPYDPLHKMKPRKYDHHVLNCKMRYEANALTTKTEEMRTCHYSAFHIVPAKKFSEHLRTCPKKIEMEMRNPRKENSLQKEKVEKGVHSWRNFIPTTVNAKHDRYTRNKSY